MKHCVWQLPLLVGFSAVAALITHAVHPLPRALPLTCVPSAVAADEICLQTVIDDWGGDCVWIDARRRVDWEKNGLPGSLLLTTADGENFDQLLELAFPTLAEKQKRVVVYCSDVGCGTSREIAKRLREYQLVPEVRALHGGWKALEQAGMVKSAP